MKLDLNGLEGVVFGTKQSFISNFEIDSSLRVAIICCGNERTGLIILPRKSKMKTLLDGTQIELNVPISREISWERTPPHCERVAL